MAENIHLYVMFALYLALMVVIGFICIEKKGTVDGYVLGGRSMGSWVTALSAQASDMSGWLLMGLPGVVYISGLCSIWISIGLLIGTALNWIFISRRLRIYTELTGSLTISSFFSSRFADNSGILRLIAAFITLGFFTIYAGSGLVAAGKLFDSMFNIDYTLAVLLGAGVILLYTLLGGYQAVCKTDMVQGTFMFFALIIVPIVAYMNIPDGALESTCKAREITFSILPKESGFWGVLSIISMSAWGLGYFGQPHILCRFMSISSHKDLVKSAKIALIWVVISLAMAVVIGFLAIPIYNNPPLDVQESEKVFIKMAMDFFNPWLGGLILAAILAAIMSTIDSQLLASSTTLAQDFYAFIIRKNASEKELLMANRIFVAGITIVACILALNPNETIFSLVTFAWGGFGASFGPVVLMSLYYRKMTFQAAICGMLAGMSVMLLWNFAGFGKYLYEIMPGFVAGVITIYFVSKFSPQRNTHILHQFDQMLSILKKMVA